MPAPSSQLGVCTKAGAHRKVPAGTGQLVRKGSLALALQGAPRLPDQLGIPSPRGGYDPADLWCHLVRG